MGLWFSVCFFFLCLFHWNSDGVREDVVRVVKGTVSIDGRAAIGNIDDDFVCATLDWWPPEKCDYGTCSWGLASLLNMDLNNPILLNAVKAFSPLKLRLGGTLQDKLIYETEDLSHPCLPFVRNTSELFGYNEGCLPLNRWDQLNGFFAKARAKVIFGLNALAGRTIAPDRSVKGAWNFRNAQSLIQYTLKKNYTIHGWELGNELSGNGIGAKISVNQYASDMYALRYIVQTAYKGIRQNPLILGPGGFFERGWFEEFIHETPQSTNVITHHIYNLGPGVDQHLIKKILDPSYLDGEADVFRNLQNILRSSATPAVVWVGEAGGAYNSGHNLVTNAFVFSFWYLDQLGMASTFDTKTYCRQTLIGGNYGLLNTTTYVPNPDYYSALLWHQLMGRKVLSASFSGTKNVRAYAHCSKQSEGVTLLLLNLDNSTTVEVEPAFNITSTRLHHSTKIIKLPPRIYKDKVREEYHLTPKDGNLQSQTVLLNGNILEVSSNGEIPTFIPKYVNGSEPIVVSPLSIVFTYIPDILLPACI